MNYLTINGINLSKYVQESTYNINSEPVYEEWTDGEWSVHKTQVRTRVKGSFDLVFVTEADFNSFKALIDANTTDNLLAVNVHVLNLGANKNVNVYYKINGSKVAEISATHVYKRFKMEIEER